MNKMQIETIKRLKLEDYEIMRTLGKGTLSVI